MTTPNPASRWLAADYASNAGFVPALGAPVLDLLAPRAGERILDLGCGDGVLTRRIADTGADVVGVDTSESLLAAARSAGLDVREMSGEALAFDAEFDAVFSNAALHWMLDGPAVATGVFRALKPGGRFVGEMGGHGNIATLRAALREELDERGYTLPTHDAQWYPMPEEFTRLYASAGFIEIEARLIRRPTPLATGVTGWLRTFRAGFMDTAHVPDAEQPAVAQAVEDRLIPAFRQPDGSWIADYVRLRFSMRKPA